MIGKSELEETFLSLVRLGVGAGNATGLNFQVLSHHDWLLLKTIADEQNLSAIILDAVNYLPATTYSLPLDLKLEWIGEVLQGEATLAVQKETAVKMAALFHQNSIRTYVLKGAVVAECYPKSAHRFSCDMDCFLVNGAPSDNEKMRSARDAWVLGNLLVAEKGYEVETIHYKNSTFYFPHLTVENHQFLTPFRGNKKLVALENVLQDYLKKDKGLDIIKGTNLYRPPVMVTALFLIEHSYSHFLHEGLTWRLVLDWMLFSKKHQNKIPWVEFDAFIDEFGFRQFYDTYMRLGRYLLGDLTDEELSKNERLMLADIWAQLDLHETVRGWKGKIALAGNTWRARWKYRYFTEMSWGKALWIQVKGFMFDRNPKLNR